MQQSLLSQGFDLMVFGMGSVVVFLLVLVVVTTVMSRILVRYLPEPVETPRRAAAPSTGSASSPVDPQTLKVLKAAIDKHRSRNLKP